MGKQHKSKKRKAKESEKTDDPIENGRRALQALRELLGYNGDLKFELKELVRSLDDGKSLDISGIPDEYVKSQVAFIFKNCSLLRRKDKYTYQSRDKPGRGSVMSLLEPVMEEPQEEHKKAYKLTCEAVQEDDEAKKPRQAGPAMPTFEERMQAQAMMQQQFDQEVGGSDIGPDLPEFIFEELEASPDPKIAAVGRIMKAIEEHQSKNLRGKDARPYDPNPYIILNVPEDVSSTDVRKAFMKLSLLLHPDKNDHPCAATSFEAAATASKRLQDESARAMVHKELEEMRRIEMTKDLARKEERSRQWKIAKGEVVSDMPVRAERQEWMTKVPEKGDPLGVSSSFST